MAFAAGLSAGAAHAQAQNKNAPNAQLDAANPAWIVNCAGEGLSCRALQTVLVRKTGQRLATVAVNFPEKGAKPAMLLHLPLGLFLPAGVDFQIDDQKVRNLQLQTCDKQGCYAGEQIAPATLQAMRTGKNLILSFQDLSKRTIKVQMSLNGFSEAFAKLK